MKKPVFVSITAIFIFSIFSIPAIAELNNFNHDNCECNCFRGKPLGECKAYWVLETGFMSRVKEDGYSDRYKSAFIANFGRMYNLSKQHSLGGILSFVSDGDGLSIGLGPRYRYWVSQRIGIDISPHLIFANTGGYEMKRYGYQINTSIAIGELFSIDGHYRSVVYKPNVVIMPQPIGSGYNNPELKDEGFYFGMSGRSYAAPVAPALYFFFLLLFKDTGQVDNAPFF